MAQNPTAKFFRSLRRLLRDSSAARSHRTRRSLFHSEALEDRTLLAADFGDAPAPYPVTIAEDGPQHADSGAFLGASRDVENDGLHSAAADADGADEDGAVWGTLRPGQLDAAVTLNVQGGNGVVDAWIDFNGDGNWGGANERILSGINLTTGSHSLTFAIPADARQGTTYARIRISNSGTSSPRGVADSGEVEDYQVTMTPPVQTDLTFAAPAIISREADGPYAVATADMDGDGDMDALSASYIDTSLRWFENDGQQNFTPHTISSTGGYLDIVAVDLDADGDQDAVSASFTTGTISWFENDGSQNFTEHVITSSAGGAMSVTVADVDGDGDLDVISGADSTTTIAWHENDGSQNFTAHTIDTAADGPFRLTAADIDRDGDLDFFAALLDAGQFLWFRNDGSQNFDRQLIDSDAGGARGLFVSDLDQDGDPDLVGTAQDANLVLWYANDGTGAFSRSVITSSAQAPTSVFAADMDGDGDVDVITTSSTDHVVGLYSNDGDQSFTHQILTDQSDGAFDVTVADINGDGDLDVLSAAFFEDSVSWHENRYDDLGDAPAPYPTRRSQDGAVHSAAGAQLGVLRTVEADGQPAAAADSESGDDGVVIGTLRPGLMNAVVDISVSGGGGRIDAWIDFNQDGSWNGADEHIFDSVAVHEGQQRLTFAVPQTAVGGQTFARFRLSSAGNLGPGGAATDGEVEDYAVTMGLPESTSANFTSKQIISDATSGVRSIAAADFDGDGDTDLVSISNTSGILAWHQNDGHEDYTDRIITSNEAGGEMVLATDINGDGATDVVVTASGDGTIRWYANDGSGNFTANDVALLASPQSLSAGDLDGDGDIDLISASWSQDRIFRYSNDGAGNFTATQLGSIQDGPRSLFTVDVDGDGDLDVLAASSFDHLVMWYENLGESGFTRHLIANDALGAQCVSAADIDQDGDMDILSASLIDDRLSWYENNGSQVFTMHQISDTANGAYRISAADIDGDGDMDIISAASAFQSDVIALYLNDGQQQFSPQTIDSTLNFIRDVQAIDVDNDGDLDVVGAAGTDNTIGWYRNIFEDYGDAPEPYAVTLNEAGPMHSAFRLSLGSSRDSEPDGNHSDAADADGSDEDGVTFGVIRPGQLNAVATVAVQGGSGRLDAWIDFDNDGSWGGQLEQIADNLLVQPGENEVVFSVPATAVAGSTVARFRLSEEGDLGVGGYAKSGEVEDYIVTITNPRTTPGDFRGPEVLTDTATGVRSVAAADLDNDGDFDLITADQGSGSLVWQRNSGAEYFTAQVISDTAAGVETVATADVDGDGDVDIITGSLTTGDVVWYENTPGTEFTAHPVGTVGSAGHLVVADLNGDGNVDLLVSSPSDDSIIWFRNDGSEIFTAQTVTSSANGVESLFAIDADRDGDLDIFAAAAFDDKVVLYEQIDQQTFAPRTIEDSLTGVNSVFAADIDSDGDIDVLAHSPFDPELVWLENDGALNFTRHTITSQISGLHKSVAADMDGDGDQDLVIVANTINDEFVTWFRNNGSQQFTQQDLYTLTDGLQDLLTLDLDNDGDLDILTASSMDDTVRLFRNLLDDFGDAPAPYQVTFAERGAMHSAWGPTLGASRDVDTDGVHSAAADADGPDDDGVTFASMRTGQLNASLSVSVNGGSGFVDAWIDFNGDGSWGGPGEQILNSVPVAPGTTELTFAVPATAVAGTTYARIRLSTDGEASIFGAASGGEVEDYPVTILSPLPSPGVINAETRIDSELSGVRSVAAADLDGDGDMDVVAASPDTGQVLWYDNDGHGAYRSRPVDVPVPGASTVLTGDFDGDGAPDVLAASPTTNTLYLFRNQGNGSFTTSVVSDALTGITGISAADVDADGDPDILTASSGSNQIAWLENVGGMQFTPQTIFSSATGAAGVTAADVDGDGDLDVISASPGDDSIRWFENNGRQVFVSHVVSSTTVQARTAVAVDLDRDGDMDILSGSAGISQLTWYRNDGSQNFTAVTVQNLSAGISSVVAADADGDGDIDLFTASPQDGQFLLFKNTGNENFSRVSIDDNSEGAFAVVATDIDGDQDLDLLTVNVTSDNVSWYRNLRDDFGDAPNPYPTVISDGGAMHSDVGPRLGAIRNLEPDGFASNNADSDDDDDGITFGSLRVGQSDAEVTVSVEGGDARLDAWIDFNGDGVWGGPGEQIFDSVDVTTGDQVLGFQIPFTATSGPRIARFRLSTVGQLGPGGGASSGEVEDYRITILPPIASGNTFGGKQITADAISAESVFSVDVDGDGDVDVISAGGSQLAWYENDGSQRFTVRTVSTTLQQVSVLFAADPDGDGDLDLVTGSGTDGGVILHENDGAQNFTPRVISTLPGISGLLAADVNADGDLDFVVASATAGTVVWLENDRVTYLPHTVSVTSPAVKSVFAADLDKDGDLDLVTAVAGDGTVRLHQNDGSAGFSEVIVTSSASGAVDVIAADVDSDGDQDLVSIAGDTIAWHRNSGTGSFTRVLISSALSGLTDVFAADFDGDSDMDLVASATGTTQIAMFRNDGGQNFSVQPVSSTSGDVSGLFTADVDSDGDLDILSSGSSTNQVFWYENNGSWNPTLNPISDLSLLEDAAEQTISLSGITAGGSELQPLRLTVSSTNTELFASLSVNYSSPAATGSLRLTPAPFTAGTAVITVTVEDGGPDNDLDTADDNATFSQSFTVDVTATRPVILAPGAKTTSMNPRIEWAAVPGAVSYQVWIGNSSNGQNPWFRGDASGTSYDVPIDLGIGKMDLWLRGVRSNGTFLPWTRMHRFNVITAPVLDDLPVRQETARPTITWPDLQGADAYDVWVNNKSTGENQVVRTNVTASEWTPEIDLPMGRYHVWVRGLGPDGFVSNWSIRESFYTAPPPLIVAPVLPTFDRTPTFEWNAVAGASSYKVFVRYLVDGSIAANVSDITETQWTPDTDFADGRYAWYVDADSTIAGFRSAWSKKQEIYIGGLSIITAPASPADSTTPLITWLPVTGAERYSLQVNGDVEGAKLIYETNLTSPQFQVTQPFVSGRGYRAWVRAVSTTGEFGPWTTAYEFDVAASDQDSAEHVVDLTGILKSPLITLEAESDFVAAGKAENARQVLQSQNAAVTRPEASAAPPMDAATIATAETVEAEMISAESRQFFEAAVLSDWYQLIADELEI